MPALITITMIWDSNITKVKPADPSGVGVAFTTSGETNPLSVGRAYTATVTLNTGYILDTVTSNNTNIVISDITENTFIFTHTGHTSTSATINITSKSNVSKVSIDLTTLTGWDNVSSGEHQISVMAKASGYLDSAKSTAISFTKASATTGETWVLNSTIAAPSNSIDENINFLCVDTSQNFIRILVESEGKGVHLEYFAQGDSSTSGTGVLTGGTEVATKYRTLTFETAPAGTLLTWLQANGTKQGGTTTAHKLTWSDSTMLVTVNGNAATSPYTLANGDTIVLKRTSGWQSINVITDTGSVDTDSTQSPLAVSNSDIKLQNGNVDMSPSMKFGFTINYEENANSGGNIQ